MQILELHLKNFGKFHDDRIRFSDQLEVISGENEYGKSTIYAFIKAMLFGMERGRGRAAMKDEFRRYEPWDNPNYYAGMIRFRCGDRVFRLERNFDRYSKSASLICENDGEELSIEDGDLEMLLGGMTASSFENIAAIGQLTAKPGQELASELRNYAANYYETGSGTIDLQGAFEVLKTRKKQVDQARKARQEERRRKWTSLEEQKVYVRTDVERLQGKLAEVERQARQVRGNLLQAEKNAEESFADQDKQRRQKEQELQKNHEEFSDGTGMRIAGFSVMGLGILIVILSRIFHMEIAGLVFGVVAFLAGIVLCLISVVQSQRVRKKVKKELRQELRQREKVSTDLQQKDVRNPLAEKLEQLKWETIHLQEEKKEKHLLIHNLQEQMEELEDETEEERILRRRQQALELAEQKLKEAAEEVVAGSGEQLNRTASTILYEITDGKYSRLLVDENLEMAVLCDGRRIPAERLSRGTLEQIYFSIRMAALEILYEEEFPVIFDDAFVCYDEKRLNSALKWLSEQPRQVIIFSCQTREKKWKDEVQ